MSFTLTALGIVGLIFLFFWLLQWRSDKTYRLSPNEVRNIVQASIDGKLNLGKFDEFSCVHIAYDKRLDKIREKYNEITGNPEYMAKEEFTVNNATPLNEAGKQKLRELISEIESISI